MRARPRGAGRPRTACSPPSRTTGTTRPGSSIRGRAGRAGSALAGLATPLLYLHGADDGCVGIDLLDEPTVAFPPDTRVEVVPAAGHFLQLERPDEVARLVGGFLDGAR